jgi:asparagine synthetase B (glutamine-hydrolysing)
MSSHLYRKGRATDRGFTTFSLVYPGLSCDESSYIDDAVDMWNVESNRLRPDAPRPSVYFEDSYRYEDFPDYPNGVMSNSISVLARRKGLRVLLTGAGGDEWLTGSFYHYADFLRRLKIFEVSPSEAAGAIDQAAIHDQAEPCADGTELVDFHSGRERSHTASGSKASLFETGK